MKCNLLLSKWKFFQYSFFLVWEPWNHHSFHPALIIARNILKRILRLRVEFSSQSGDPLIRALVHTCPNNLRTSWWLRWLNSKAHVWFPVFPKPFYETITKPFRENCWIPLLAHSATCFCWRFVIAHTESLLHDLLDTFLTIFSLMLTE